MKELQFVIVQPSGDRVVLVHWYMNGDDPYQIVSELRVQTTRDDYNYNLATATGGVILAAGSYLVLEDVTKPEWPTPIEFI